MGESDFLLAKFVIGLTYLLVKVCGFQACQYVAFVPAGESLITAAVNSMASSIIAITFNAHNECLNQ